MVRLSGGESVRAVESALNEAPSSVVKWTQRLRESGSHAETGREQISRATARRGARRR